MKYSDNGCDAGQGCTSPSSLWIECQFITVLVFWEPRRRVNIKMYKTCPEKRKDCLLLVLLDHFRQLNYTYWHSHSVCMYCAWIGTYGIYLRTAAQLSATHQVRPSHIDNLAMNILCIYWTFRGRTARTMCGRCVFYICNCLALSSIVL